MSGFFGSLFGSTPAPNKATLSSGATAGTNSKAVKNLEKGPANVVGASPYNASIPVPIQVAVKGGKRSGRRRHQSRKQTRKQRR